nr:MAG TPA: Cytosine specific methyltransferase [Caudoviricetes sp.]
MAERPLYTLYKNLKAQNYDVPDDYNKFESALTRDGKVGADNRHAIYENLKAQNFDVPSTYERFYSALFEPRSKTSSRAKGGSVPMTAADRARFSAGAASISASAQQTMNNAGRYNRLKQRKQKHQKDFGRVNLGTHQTPYGGDANNVVKDDFAYNPETGKAGAYVTSDNENVYSLPEAEQSQAQDIAYQNAVDTGEIPSVLDVRDKSGNYDLQENINKNGTYLTEEGAQKQFDKKLEDAYARKKEIEAAIAEDHRLHGNPLLSYGASIGASNGRTAEQSDYSNKLATSLALVNEQIGALEAVKQYPTSSWGEDALKALDNTAFTAKTWDFGLIDFATMGQMERIKTKMDNNIPLSGSDKMLLKSKLGADAAAALEDEKMGNIYRWTKIAGQSLPFMADFFLTGGYGGITKGISRGALKFSAKRGMGKVSAAILKNTGIVAGDVIGSYEMAGTEQALKTGADIMKRHLGNLYQDEKGDYKFGTFDENGNLLHEGGESMGTALYKGMTSAMVENYTEKLFGHNYGIKKGAVNFMEKHGMNASAEFFKNIGKSGWYTNSKKWMEKFGINGFAEEVMEEEIGIPLHALLDGEGKVSDLLDARQQLDIIGGMAISVGSMYAMGAGSRPIKGIYNRAQYYRFRNKVNVADSDAQNLLGDNWAGIKDKIDNATNEQMGSVLADILRQRDTMTKEQINAAVNYGINLMKMRGYNIAKTAEMNAKEITNEPTTPEEQHQTDFDNAYSEGHDADDADKHDIQIQQEDQMKTLAAALGISEQQLSAMSDEELESLTGQDDKLDQAIYDYQLSSARYQGVVDDAQDKVDLAAHQAEQRVDMYTDQSRGSVRNATIKASGGLEDYGVYIISGNIATHDDGSIDVSNSDDMILYYDPTTNSVEHADALMFVELGEELPADDVKAQAVADAKENAIKEVAGIIDGTVEVGSQFSVTGADGMEHTYEVLADYGDGTAAISIDGNVVENPYSFADLQNLKDLEDQKRLEAAKAQREQMEKERAEQQNQEIEETQPSFDFNQILNDNGNVVLVDVLDKDGNTKYPDSRLFLIRDAGVKAKVVELKSDGSLVPHAVSKKNVSVITSMSLDEYKQAMAESSMIEDNSGENRGEIEVEAPAIEGETAAHAEETAAPESAETPVTEQTPAITLEDGTIVPMLEDGNPDFSKLTAAQTAELYDTQFGEDAESVISSWVSDAKKALDKASNMTVKGKTFVEQKAAKDAKEKAIADAQAAYNSAIAIRDAYNERQLAKVEDTAEGRKELIEKARRKFVRLKSAVKDDAESVAQIYKETVGTLLHRLYDGTGIDVTDTIPLTAEEYVASNLGAHSLNYEGTETSKGVKQETGLSREDFAKTQLLAADGKGTTIDNLVHSLWENRPSNLDSLGTQDIRNVLLSVITSGFKASEARNYIENLRIAQAENILEEQKKAADNAAFAEENKAESEQQAETAHESEEKTGEENSDEINDEENEKINAPEVPEDATDENPFGAQRDQTDLPFSARDNGTQQTTSERAADVEKNKVDDLKVVDNIVGQQTRKAFERLAKMMGANIQWQYSDKLGNGWIQETTDADGNVHRTIFITLDSSITEGAQFIFGHEMTHQIKSLNPAAYNELTQLVIDTYGSDAFDKAVDETMQRYSDAGFSGRARDYYAEEVVADAVGEMIRDLNLAHTLAMKMSHPLLAAIHEILQKIKLAFYGTEYSDVTKNIIRSIEQAYVKTANGEVTNSETGEDVSFSLRQKPEPKKKGIGYKVFVLKDGKLYPPMVANPDGAATPVGVWLDADAAPIAGESKTGRPQVKQGGKGTQGGSGKLAYRPGWHLGVVPYAIQFNRKDAEGNKTLFPKNFVFAEVEYAADVDYQEEARQEGINPSGKYQHSLAGLKHLPTDGYYMYRTNPNPETDPWVITGAMKVNRILTRAEQAELVKNAGREPQQIQEGDIVTDDVVNSINQEIANAPKFSIKTYHGSQASFDKFDHAFMGSGEGAQAYGWGTYVSEVEGIAKAYAKANAKKNAPSGLMYDTVAQDLVDTKSGLDLLEDELKDAKSYVDLYQSRLDEAKEELSKAKESGTGLGVDMYESDIEYYSKQVERYKQSIKTKESDIKDVKNKVDALQKKLDSMEKPRNLYSVDIPDDTGRNYIGWDEPLGAAKIMRLPKVFKADGWEYKKVGMYDTYKIDGNEHEVWLEPSLTTGKELYRDLTNALGSDKAASEFLSKAGFVGVKVIAQRNTGGNKEGKMNYVIFDENNAQITSHTKFSLKDIKPVGKNQFGDVYDQFKGKPKEAFDFLLENKDGYLKGVFHRDEIGDIDLAYGSAPNPYKGKGLAHIIRKHVETLHDFPSVDDAINTITDVISNGVVKDGSIPNTYDIENGDYRVVVAADKNGNWVLTAFDYVNPTKKKKKGTATALPPSQSSDGAGAVAPNLSAAKIDNSSETTKENGEKFSLKDEKTLAGVHNITEEKLRKALKLGGFANPSLAVIDTNKTGHDNFGEISFIAPSALLDKRTGNTGGTWITDAYTQRYPSVEREMSEKGYRKFEDWVDSLDYPSGAKAEIERQAKDALSDNNTPAWELMYLKEKGIDIKEYDSRIDYRWKEIISDHPTAEDILNSMQTDPELNEKVTSLAKHAIIHPTWEKVSLEVRRKMYEETGVKASPINPQVRKQTKEIFERDYAPSLLNKNGTPKKSDVKKVVEQMVKEHNDTKKYNFYLSKVKASNYVNKNGLYDDYIRWQENKLDEFGTKNRIFRGYTKDGSRKYVPETLENVSKVMREEADGQTNGSEYTSFGSFIAKLASRVDSTDEMRANKDKLSSNKDKEEFYEKWSEVYYDLAKFLYNDVFYGEQRLHDIVLQSDPKKYAKKEYGITLTPAFMKKLDALKNAVQIELKSAYFETKYNRPLRLNEFAAAVVPDNLGEDVRKGIENAGLPMYNYDPNKEGDRSRAFNEAINSSDNIRFSLAGERGAAAADKAEERTARMDNLSVARKMEEEKKDAKAIKMATGWERGADGKWRYEIPDAKIKDTMDVGGGHIVKRYEDDMLWNGGKLSEVIDAPELFKAYPQLKDVLIDTDAIMNDMPSNGEYNSKTNTITIHADELKYMNGILNHEIQHAIQDIEGFAKGGSPILVRGEVKKRFDEVTKQIKQLRAEGKEDEAKALIEKNRGLYNAYQKNDDFNSYKSLAGEVEARNVSARLNMTPEERRKSLAESTEDVARKDQIFLGVGDVSFSLRDMADGKESGAADMAEDLKSLNTPDEVDDAIKTAIDDMPSGWKMANKKMIHIAQALGENRKAEIAGEEPKFSLKGGTLIKAGTYFSGGGLVEEGLKGIIDPVLAVEYDEKISGVYRNNFGQHIVTADVRDVDPKELVKQIDGEVEYFHASPVCKNYSQAKSNHSELELDKETAASTAEFINAVKPKVVTIENVKGYKDSDAMKTITDALDANGYTWDADVYNAADYGGYTNRERLIVRAVRDGKLPAKPKKMAHKSGWYEAVADIIPTLTEKKNGVAPWMDVRLKADGIDWRNIDKPLYVMGSAYADGKVPHAFADELLPTLRTKSGDVVVMPDGKVYRAMGRVLARVSGVSDDYKMPFSESLSHTIIGNGIPTQLTEHVIAPLLTGSDPKFSIRTYHGTGASFDKFDLSHALEGEGSETFGHGVYVTNSSKIGREYAQRAKNRKMEDLYKNMRYPDGVKGDIFKRRVFGEMVNDVATGGSVASAKEFAKKRVGADANDIQRTLENLKDREKGTEYEQNLKDRLAEYKEGLKWIDSLDEDYLTQGNANRYDVDIPDDNGENYLGWNESQNFPLEKWYRLWEITHEGFNENEYFKDGGARYDIDRIERITQMKLESPENGMQRLPTLKGEELYHALEDFFNRERPSYGAELASRALSEIGFVGIKYPAGLIHGGAEEGDYNYVIFDENNANIVGNTRFSLRYDQFEHDLNQWKKDNNLPKDAQRPTIPQRNAGESAVDFLRRVDEYRKQMALWKTAPTYEQHLLSDDTALGEFNRELQKGSVLKRIAFQDSMLAIRKAQEAIMKEVGVDRLNMAEDAYTAENRSHGKGKNEFEEYNNEFLQPLRKAYHQMKKILGDSYDNVRIYMMAKHGLERDAQMAFKKSLDADFEDVAQRSAAYRAYKGDMNRITNDSDLEFGRVDFNTWRQRDNALRTKYSPSYMDYRYDENGIAYDYSGLSALFGGSDFEEAAHKLVRDIESSHVAEVQDLWNATNAATKKILRDGYKAGMMSKDTYLYVRDMYSHYIPLRGWDGTTADQVWDYVGGGKGAFNQTLKTAHGRTSIANDPIAYIENMAESGILLNNKNWVKQHLMLLAQNHPTSLLTLSKAWYVKSTDVNGNEEWIPATPQITSQMNSNQVKAAIDAFEQNMEKMAQTGDATQKRDGLNIAYPQTHSEEREHEVRVMKDGEEYAIYVNGDPQLAQAMNNTRAHRVREIQSGKLDRAAAWLGRKMAAAYTSLSPLFIPSNYFRDLTMTLASTAIREDAKYNYLLRKNMATSWNLGFMLRNYQNGKLREKVSNGNATPKEQMFYDFMMNGGETGFVSSLDVEDLKKKFKNDLKDLDRWKANPVKVGHTIMDGIEFLNRAIEDSNRFAVYMTSIQYGRSIDEAVNDAKDVTLNFNRKGTGEYGWQMVRNLYLFINPAVQSLQTLGALAKHHPFKFTAVTASWLVSGVLVPIVNAALMNLLGGDDDKDKYWQFTKWDRRNNLILWVPFTHEYVKIPLAQEFRAFYGVGDMIASKMMGGELAEESWNQYAEDLLGQVVDMLPLDPTGYDGNIAVSLMPNAIRPVFELAFNVDFTGKPLFKDTEYNKYDPNFTKAYVGTPDWLVRASRMVNSIGNDYPDVQQNSIDAFGDPRYNLNNPAVVDHVLSSYLGGAYTMGSQVLGVLTKSLNDPKEIKVSDIPLFSKFVSNPDDRPVTKKQGDEFWDMKENHDRAANTLSKLKKQAKVDGDYSMLERFYGSEEYKQYQQDDVKVKKYEEDKKKERAEESGEEYRPHKLNAEDIYKAHATPKDDFEDLKLKQLYTKLNGFKTSYDLLVDTAPGQSDGYYNTNKAAIDAIDEISLDKQEISELKKGFLDDGKDAYNAEDMKQIRELRKKILAVLEKANKVVVANQKAKAEK